MKKLLPLLGAALALGFTSCANMQSVRTNYVAPSSAGVKASVAGAQQKVTSAQKHAKTSAGLIVQSSAGIKAAAARAKTVTDRLKVIAAATEPTPAVHSLVLQVQGDVDFLTKELLGVRTANDALAVENAGLSDDLRFTTQALGEAIAQLNTLQAAIKTQTTELNDTAKKLNAEIVAHAADKAVVAQVNSWWGLGAFAYGIKRLLVHLLWLTLGIVVLIVALVILATLFPAFGAIFVTIMAFIRMIFDKVGSAGRSGMLATYPHTIPPGPAYIMPVGEPSAPYPAQSAPSPFTTQPPADAPPIAPADAPPIAPADPPVIAPTPAPIAPENPLNGALNETSPASRAAAAPLAPRPPIS